MVIKTMNVHDIVLPFVILSFFMAAVHSYVSLEIMDRRVCDSVGGDLDSSLCSGGLDRSLRDQQGCDGDPARQKELEHRLIQEVKAKRGIRNAGCWKRLRPSYRTSP